jgi:hypothetical protein
LKSHEINIEDYIKINDREDDSNVIRKSHSKDFNDNILDKGKLAGRIKLSRMKELIDYPKPNFGFGWDLNALDYVISKEELWGNSLANG